MKILLTTLNSKYVHTNLALKYLYTVVADTYSDLEMREFTINQEPGYIYGEILRGKYDLVCFSCYIWNIEQIKALAADLKKARPDLRLCLGGPEVSYDGAAFAAQNRWADLLLCGEGEYSFYRLCQVLSEGGALETVPGLIYRQDGKIYVNAQMEPLDFNVVPFPYAVLDCDPKQVIYYESARGCPFRCTYCLSSIEKNKRPLALDRVRAELSYFLRKKVMQVKFVDRTFNYDAARARTLFAYLIEHDNGVTNFHFELCGDLLDQETLDLLAKARPGLFQFEIGIQSTNPQTLAAVGRPENVYPLLYHVEKLVRLGNSHVHVDLIAGLPYESYEIFGRSFDRVYALGADALQLGFLKVLKGTPICGQLEAHEIVYRDRAPYEVISTAYLSAEELARLHRIENMVEVYHNRGGFTRTLRYLIEQRGGSAFGFFAELADFYYAAGYQHRLRKKEDQYRILLQFAASVAGTDAASALPRTCLSLLREDMAETFQAEECHRFEKKGWEIEP